MADEINVAGGEAVANTDSVATADGGRAIIDTAVTVAPNRRPYATRDGHVAALIYNDKHWRAFIDAVRPAWDSPEYATLALRAKQIDTVYGLVAQTMLERTTAEWLTLFAELEIPATPINTLDALFDSPQLNAAGLFETVQTPDGPVRFPGVPTWFSRTPGRVRGPAPMLGADTEAVLGELQADVRR